jgi:hypothetical protein
MEDVRELPDAPNAKWKGPVSDSGSLAGSAEDDNRLRGFRLQAQLLE